MAVGGFLPTFTIPSAASTIVGVGKKCGYKNVVFSQTKRFVSTTSGRVRC